MNAQKAATYPWLLSSAGLLALAALLTWLFMRADAVSPHAHYQYLAALRGLQQADVELNAAVLALRTDLLHNYDMVVSQMRAVRDGTRTVAILPDFLSADARTALSEKVRELAELHQYKAELIDRFQRSLAVLRNSRHYFPAATEQFLRKVAADRRLEADAGRFVRRLLTYIGSSDAQEAARLRAQADELAALPLPAAERRALDHLLTHARVIIERQIEVDGLAREILQQPTAALHEELVRLYAAAHRQTQHAANHYRLLLYAVALLLAGYLIWAYLRIERDQRELAATHRALLERYEAQCAAEERLRLFATVFSNASEGMIITDAATRIIAINPAFSAITGYSESEVLGQTPAILHSGQQSQTFYHQMWLAIKASGKWRGEIWNRRKDGTIYPEWLSIATVQDEAGRTTHYIGIFSDLSEIKRHEAQLVHLAYHDPLTGLPNRSLLNDRFTVALSQAQRNSRKLAVCYLDLDGFKPINDRFGHPVGDRLLKEIAKRLSAAIRGGDTVARLGGDEFLLLLTNLANVEEGKTVLERIRAAVAKPVEIDGQAHRVTASIGVTLYPDDSADADTLLRHADQALYAAKEAGRNRYQLYDPQKDNSSRQRRRFFEQIERALGNDEFELFYQPKVNMRDGRLIGVEALIRWRHPERGLILPDEFLPQLEGSELEIRLDEWVINQALVQIGRWRAQALDIPIAVNIAPAHLAYPDFSTRLKGWLDRHPDTPRRMLEIEVLESAALADLEHCAEVLDACRSFGVRVALDDFGTGYASLAYLKHLPVDLVKIDQGFVRGAPSNASDLAIVEAVIGLAEAFHLEVLAEGVETVGHGTILIQLGCLLGQGCAISRPMPAKALVDWATAWQPDSAWTSQPPRRSRDDAVLGGAEIDHRLWLDQLQA